MGDRFSGAGEGRIEIQRKRKRQGTDGGAVLVQRSDGGTVFRFLKRKISTEKRDGVDRWERGKYV